jgi:hypothetical protein
MMDLAPELIVANHPSSADMAEKSCYVFVPTIIWNRPDTAVAVA